MISSTSEDENETPELWVNNGAYTLNCGDKKAVLSQRGWLSDKIICAAQIILLQYFPNMAGLQPATMQKVFGFHAHSGEFVQIIHVRNNHWCVVSIVGCQSGVVHLNDSLYKTLSKKTEYWIAKTVHVPSSDLIIVMVDVDKQSSGSDCGVLTTAYAFDLYSCMDPCIVRFDHRQIRHLATCLENCQVSRFPILGDQVSMSRESQRWWSSTVHVACQREIMKNLLSVTPAMCAMTATAWTFPLRCLMWTLRSTGSVRGVCSHMPSPVPLVNQHSLRTDSNGLPLYLSELLLGVSPGLGLLSALREFMTIFLFYVFIYDLLPCRLLIKNICLFFAYRFYLWSYD